MGTDIELLKEVTIFRNFTPEQLEEISRSFKRAEYAKDDVIFREKSEGDTLFIVAAGEVIIEKKLDDEGRTFKQLALLSKGEFFGEMAVLEGAIRFAQARAAADAVLYEVKRLELFKFIKERPETGISIFIEVMKVLSRRLQHTSSELTMLYDLAKLVMADTAGAADFVKRTVEETAIYFEGAWNINGYLYNVFNEEYDPVVSRETFAAAPDAKEYKGEMESRWVDERTYLMVYRAHGKPLGYVLFSRSAPLSRQEQNSLATIFNTVASILGSALENIGHRTEAALMQKLKTQKNYI